MNDAGFMGNLVKIIDIPKFGSVKVDRYIADLIYDLNHAGIATMNCCSGILEDHPYDTCVGSFNAYIQFAFNKGLWEMFCENGEFFYDNDIRANMTLTLPHPSAYPTSTNITLSFMHDDNELRKEIWQKVFKLLYEYINNKQESGEKSL